MTSGQTFGETLKRENMGLKVGIIGFQLSTRFESTD
jgi:hypothetical protein